MESEYCHGSCGLSFPISGLRATVTPANKIEETLRTSSRAHLAAILAILTDSRHNSPALSATKSSARNRDGVSTLRSSSHNPVARLLPSIAESIPLSALQTLEQCLDRALNRCGPGRATRVAEDLDAELGPSHSGLIGREQALADAVTALGEVSVVILSGVAGVGKTSIARELALTWSQPSFYLSAIHLTPTCGESCSGRQQLPGAAGCDPALAALLARLDRIAGLLVIDDFHLLSEGDRGRIVDTAARVLVDGRLVLATRERIAAPPDNVDQTELRLPGIDRASAELLWKRLDELNGTAHGFAAAWRWSQGNPLALRHAHAGAPAARHPLIRAIQTLDDDERCLLDALASSDRPVPVTALAPVVPGRAIDPILASLAARLFVDAARRRHYTIDAFVRATLSEKLGPIDGGAAAPRRAGPLRVTVSRAVKHRYAPPAALVIDGARHELRVGARHIPLSSRFVLRRLLYTFMAMPGHRMTREAIARTLWSVDYDPQRHASSLKSNIRRLRNVLTGTSAAIETCENGYRLCLPSGALFTPPEE